MSFKSTKGLGTLTIGCTFEITEIIKPGGYYRFSKDSLKTKIGKLVNKTELGDMITVLYSSTALTNPRGKELGYQRITVINHTKSIQTTNSLLCFQDFFNRIKNCKQI